jgi:hypothetical protein
MDGRPIANKYCEGKMKRTLKREWKDLKSLRRKRYTLMFLMIERRGEQPLSFCQKKDKIKLNRPKKGKTGQGLNSLRDYGDFVKMVYTVPSWNTDQGVYLICECASGKTHTRNESDRCAAQASTSTDLGKKVWVRAYRIGPERWWTMPE